RSRSRSQDGLGARTAVVLSAGGDTGAVRSAATCAGCRTRHGARARGVTAHDDAAGPSRSGGGRGRHRACGLLPHAARPPAREPTAGGTAAAVLCRRPPHTGAVPDTCASVRLSLRRTY